MDTMELYRRAQDGLAEVLAGAGPDRWDGRSVCAEWSVRDVVGHLIWGQRQMLAWATGVEYADESGGPGAPSPRVLAGTDPAAVWRAARDESVSALTGAALARTASVRGIGEVPVAAMVALLTTDQVVHTWDIGHALGMRVRLDPALVSTAFAWARTNTRRAPGFFGPERTPPDDCDEQTRLLAFLGRAAWQPVRA